MASNITQTGPQNYRQLQNQNDDNFDFENASVQDQYKYMRRAGDFNSYARQPVTYVGVQAASVGYGDSKYDKGITSMTQLEHLNDYRYSSQPWYDVVANGVGKMLGKAATTFASSLIGLPYGLISAVKEGRWSAIWDNDVTNALSDVDEWFENNMTNYQSEYQKQNPNFRFGDLNWWMDTVVSNAGFALGAAASMGTAAGGMGLMSKALGLAGKASKAGKGTVEFLSSLFSATGEGMIEAKQGVDARNKLKFQELDDAMLPEKTALTEEYNAIFDWYDANKGKEMVVSKEGKAYDPAYVEFNRKMDDWKLKMADYQTRYNTAKQEIIDSGQRMGNAILLGNQVLLTAGDIIQYGKGMVKSYDRARHMYKTLDKKVRPSLVNATRTAEGTYKVGGKGAGRAWAILKNPITEGSEEMNQQFISSAAGAYYDRKDVNDYWRARLNPKAISNTSEGLYDLGKAINQGWDESWGGGKEAWEQFFVGAFTGAKGMYMPTKIFNQDKSKSVWNPMRYGEISGGIAESVRGFNKEYSQYEENIDELNKILQSEDFPARVQSMVGRTYLEGVKQEALEKDDKKAWKDADDKQSIMDVQAFVRAGKLDDLKAIYKQAGENLTDEVLDNIFKGTTKKISAEEDKQNHDRNMDVKIAAKQLEVDGLKKELSTLLAGVSGSVDDARDTNRAYFNQQSQELVKKIDAGEKELAKLNLEKQNYVGQKYYDGAYVDNKGNRTVTNDQLREIIKHNTDELDRKLDSYLESIDAVNEATGGILTKDQEDNLAYLHNMGKLSNERMQKIMAKARKNLPNTFLLKTNKTPEQLSEEYATSDLAFSKKESTKEGYVEVDTGLMTDAAFADFFQREVLRGRNIYAGFAETADERAVREAEEKNLSPKEKAAKAKERLSKKIEEKKAEVDEQWNTNWERIRNNFLDKQSRGASSSIDELLDSFNSFVQELQDASDLYNQTREYYETLHEYLSDPSLVDKDKAKEEVKAQKSEGERQAKNKFAGKEAKQIKQELADGTLDFNDFNDFAGASLEGVTDEDVKAAQKEVQRAQEGNNKVASIKQHVQEQLGDNPSAQDLEVANIVNEMLDRANLSVNDATDINLDAQELRNIPLSAISTDATDEEIEFLNQQVQGMLAKAFTSWQEDLVARNDIPDASIKDMETPSSSDAVPLNETGKDPVTKVPAEVVAPKEEPQVSTNDTVPEAPLTEGAIDNIVSATKGLYSKTSEAGAWRTCTTRHPYEKTTGTYHEDIAKKQFGEDSIQYKRSKAIWEYLNSEGAFDRTDNPSADRIKVGETIHFMVKNMSQEIYGKAYNDLTEEEKPYALVLLMLNDNGEVLGDLPLAQWEPSYKEGNPNDEVRNLLGLQDKILKAFDSNYKQHGSNEAVVDSMPREGSENLNLTYTNGNPLVSEVNQVMRGGIPFVKGETNNLNDIAQGAAELALKIAREKVAIHSGDRKEHKEILIPSVGSLGQPYILLPTPSGEKYAIPFYMPAFDAERHKDTELYRMLKSVLQFLTRPYTDPNTTARYFHKHIDVLEGLLQVKRQNGVKNVVELLGSKVTIHLQSLTNPDAKIDITVPNTPEGIDQMIQQLSGIPINVSLQFINGNIEVGIADGERYTQNYNTVIGEIANANLPKNTTHSVNGWFTVELSSNAGTQKTKKVTPKITGIVSTIIGGRTIEIDISNGVAVDPNTGEIIQGDEEVNLAIAKAKAAQPIYSGKKRIKVTIDGEARTYDVEKNVFVGNESLKTETKFQETVTEESQLSSSTPSEAAKAEAQENQPEESVVTTEKTLEQINEEMKEMGVLLKSTEAAWNAIPDELKLKLVNEGKALSITYGSKTEIISMDDIKQMILVLKAASRMAKTGKMKVEETVKPMEKSGVAISKESEIAARRWLSKNLPTLSSEERTQFVEKIARMGDNANKYWGSYRSGVLQIRTNAPMGTVYHEAFHYVLDMVLDVKERKEILQIAKEEYGIDNSWEAEERLAEDFRKYVMDENATGIIGKLKRWFRKLMDKIRRYDRISNATVNQLFWKINNGELAQKAIDAESFEDAQQNVLREIRNTQQEKAAWSNLDSSVKQSLKEAGLTEEKYNQLSLEEKNQYLKCAV